MSILTYIEKTKTIPLIGHDIYMIILISPALIVNYGLVFYVVPPLLYAGHKWLFMSPVVIGDLIGLFINSRIFKRYYKP